MTREEITEKVLAIVKEALDLEEVDLEADFQDNYDVDSIGMMDVLMSMEDEFGIQFSDEELEDLSSLQDLIDSIQAKLAA